MCIYAVFLTLPAGLRHLSDIKAAYTHRGQGDLWHIDGPLSANKKDHCNANKVFRLSNII